LSSSNETSPSKKDEEKWSSYLSLTGHYVLYYP
jgi:hypothetical protein